MASQVETKQLKEQKELVTIILQSRGIDYDTWLKEQYQGLIAENAKFIAEGLKAKQKLDRQSKNDQHGDARGEIGTSQSNGGASRG